MLLLRLLLVGKQRGPSGYAHGNAGAPFILVGSLGQGLFEAASAVGSVVRLFRILLCR